MNEMKLYYNDNQNYVFFSTQKEITDENNKTRLAGGVTSGVLRYPHLIQELIEIKRKEIDKTNTDLLILGPGLSSVGRVSSPHLHEILAAFSANTHVTVVDINDELISEIGKSVFGFNERYLAESLLTAYNGHSVKKYSKNTIDNIRDYVEKISERVTQNIKIQKEDFANFKTSTKYDYIFAIQSLVYALLNCQSSNSIEEKKNSLLITAKYLGALKDNGVLIVDEILYDLMRKHLTYLPNLKDFQEAEIRWDYKTKTSSTPFTARKIEVPNNTRCVEKTAKVFYIDQENNPRDVSTTDLYFITRLEKK